MKNSNKKAAVQNTTKKDPALYKDESNTFIEELKKNYHFEKILNKRLPEMIENETREEIIEGLTKHLIFTSEHLARLKEFFNSIGETEIVVKHEVLYGKDKTEEQDTTHYLK